MTYEQAWPIEEGFDDYTAEELEDYAAWANEPYTPTEVSESYPDSFELDEAASQRKKALHQEVESLLIKLGSDDVRSKGYYSPGGGAEVVNELRDVQLRELAEIYAKTRFESPYLQWHAVQETPVWCQIASASNALEALGRVPVPQTEIAAAYGVAPEGRPFPDEMKAFLATKGLETRQADTVVQVIDELVAGNKLMLGLGYPAYPLQHTILVSGIRIDQGQIEFWTNDSAHQQGAQRMSLARMLELLEPPLDHNVLTRSFIVSAA